MAEILCRHIPDRFEHLVRYVGWYSNRNRVRRQRAKNEQAVPVVGDELTGASLIHKVYEVDPLICPVCQGPMRVIALVEDDDVIRHILEHLGCWAPREARQYQRAPPQHPDSVILESTYHPLPDIA